MCSSLKVKPDASKPFQSAVKFYCLPVIAFSKNANTSFYQQNFVVAAAPTRNFIRLTPEKSRACFNYTLSTISQPPPLPTPPRAAAQCLTPSSTRVGLPEADSLFMEVCLWPINYENLQWFCIFLGWRAGMYIKCALLSRARKHNLQNDFRPFWGCSQEVKRARIPRGK